MKKSLLFFCGLGSLVLATTPLLSSAGEAVAGKLAAEVARFTSMGETRPAEKEETEFGRHLLESWKKSNVELPMPEEQILTLIKGTRRISTAPEVELPENMRFTGFLQYSNVDGVIRLPYGFYTFAQKDGLQRKLYKNLPSCLNGGGAYVGNYLFGLSNIEVPTSANPDYSMKLYQWDTDTWKMMDEPTEGLYDLIAAGVDVDPVSKKVYGITFGDSGRSMLSVIDYAAHTKEDVGDLFPDCTDAAAFAISPEGIGYVLDRTGTLLKVDLSSASSEKIGDIDFEFYAALQSMTFDPITGKLYLAASEGDIDNGEMYGRLCEVSLEDASTKLVGYLPESEEYTVLHVVYDPLQDAPGAIDDLAVCFTDTSLNGTVSFTLPTSAFGGATLSGDINYDIYLNDSVTPVISGIGKAGEPINAEVPAAEGRTKYVVVLTNQAGKGERNAIESWGGMDTPATVKASAEATGNSVMLSWEAGGANNGFADLDGITYTIFRFPGPTMIAEGVTGNTYTDDISDEPNGAFVYNIVPVRDFRYFQGMKTEPIYGGIARELPYTQDFESDDASYEFKLLSNHSTGWQIVPDWQLEGAMWYNPSPYVDADAWAIAPALLFEEGNTYIINVTASRTNPQYDEYLSIGIGEDYRSDEYQTILDRYAVKATSYEGTDKIRLVYECCKTGGYHIGLNAVSPRNQSAIIIHEISVEQGLSVNVPGAVNDLSASTAPNGELAATIRFTAPSTNVGGKAIDSLTKATLYRGDTDTPVAVLTDIIPGQHYSIVDEDAMNGCLDYTVTTWNEYGEGEPASVSVYVGIDLPVSPSDVSVKDNLDGTYMLEWNESATGVNGGVVDLDEVTYNVYLYADGSLKEIATDVEGTHYVVKGLDTANHQEFKFLSVSAVNDLGESEPTEAPVITTGDPYLPPFMEGFAHLEGIWMPEGASTRWSLYSGMSSDEDNFLMGAKAYEENAKGSLRSGKFCFNGVADPKVVFSFYGIPGIDNTLALAVSREGNAAERILTIPFNTLEGPEGWRTCIVDFSAYVDADYFSLVFETDINDEDYDFIYFDDINVRDVPDHNLSVTVKPQNRVTAGEEARVDVCLHNVGTSAESSYNVGIYLDDNLLTTLSGIQMQPFERATLSYRYPVPATAGNESLLKAVIVDEGDRIETDNVSEATMKVVASLLPAPECLTTAETDGDIKLTWNAPMTDIPLTDSFEGYESFIYDGFGNWQVVDGDGMKTIPVIDNNYPGYGEPASFFTVDFSSLGYEMTSQSDFAGHSGESLIACVRPTNLMSDDWLISPELSGAAQTVTLYAKSVGAVFSDTFEILYSENGTEIENFISSGITCEPNGTWQEFSVELPVGAKYFAIHCNSFYGGMLMIDDVTYQGVPLILTDYNIYRNGSFVASVKADTTEYTESIPSAKATYQVTAVYKTGESSPCSANTSLKEEFGMHGVEIDTFGGYICISNSEGHNVSVVSADGKILYNGTVRSNLSLPASMGVYVVTVGSKTQKILIK